jgi:hypothetical protein
LTVNTGSTLDISALLPYSSIAVHFELNTQKEVKKMGTREAALKNLEKRKSKGGRPTGCRNRFTTLKESFLKAYEAKDGFGGDEALKRFAKANPYDFLQMVKTMLPKNMEVKSENQMIINVISSIPEPKPRPE